MKFLAEDKCKCNTEGVAVDQMADDALCERQLMRTYCTFYCHMERGYYSGLSEVCVWLALHQPKKKKSDHVKKGITKLTNQNNLYVTNLFRDRAFIKTICIRKRKKKVKRERQRTKCPDKIE